MKKDMLGEVVRKIVDLPREMLGAICDLAEKLSGEACQVWFAEFKKFLRKEKCWSEGIINILLEMINTVTIPARIVNFIARDKFIVDTSKEANVKISYLGDNFTKWFLGEDGKIETPIGEQELRCARLKKASVDDLIIAEIGVEAKAETTLSEMFSQMEKQRNGEAGVLLNNGYANIFYIRDKNGVLRAVPCGWCGDGWDVRARSVDDTDGWRAVRQVFFRVPVAA